MLKGLRNVTTAVTLMSPRREVVGVGLTGTAWAAMDGSCDTLGEGGQNMVRSSSLLVSVGLLLCLETYSRAQEATPPDQVEVGRKFAALVCANCHVTAPDKQTTPILTPQLRASW